ncbi:MAG: hypothetical protein AAFP03_09355 [Cyanobacteria bacterium J06598_3]
MATQEDAINYAKHFGWTGADAKRAFAGINLKEADELALLTAMVNFAGPTLYERQRLQGAQKGLVTKKEKQIKKIEKEFSEKINTFEEQMLQERSVFVGVIGNIYQIARRLGYQGDPWVETLLEQYEERRRDVS